METSTPEVITFDAVKASLDRCMTTHPPTGIERSLHRDADAMADLFALMALDRLTAFPKAEVDADLLAIFDRWAPT